MSRGRDARADAWGLANINYRKLQVDCMAPNHGAIHRSPMLWVHSPAMEAARVISELDDDGRAILAAKSNDTLARSLPIVGRHPVASPYNLGGTRDGQQACTVIGLRRADVGVAPSDAGRCPDPGEAGRPDTQPGVP